MINSKSIRRGLLLTTALAACAAPTASARVADAPLRGGAVSTAVQTHGVPPRVNGIGNQPSDPSGQVAVPIVKPASHVGFDWTSAAIGAAALVSLSLLGAATWATFSGRRHGWRPPPANREAPLSRHP